jgi:cupin 2 domain-containing protein
MVDSGNLFRAVPEAAREELFDTLVQAQGVTVERIVSTGQATPPGEWYDQAQHEFVVLMAGSAALRFEAESGERELEPGDWVWIPAHARHRVVRTSAHPAAVWLAVFMPQSGQV